jgi:hypothetical protein
MPDPEDLAEAAQWYGWLKAAGLKSLRGLAMEVWDPIGVRDAPSAQDEYDTYLGHVAAALRRGEDVEQIGMYLSSIRTAYMGLPPQPERDRQAAQAFVNWYAQLEGLDVPE